MSDAFAKLHPKIQEAVWNQHWGELRPLQVGAINAVFETKDHLVLAAATASGKTEAVFLPLLSQIANEPAASVQVLYISPLKALINDQFRRLEDLCVHADIPVHRWHGDVSATDKRNLRKSPSGVLLITPESLESQFVNYDRDLSRMYTGLRAVVVDELHAFLDNVRGIHLLSLLSRLNIAANIAPRRFGLSATLGDFKPAREFLCGEAPETVCVIEDPSQQKELRVGLKAFLDVNNAGEGDPDIAPPQNGERGLGAIASEISRRFRTESNLIFCNSRRQTELLADKLNSIARSEQWARNPFLLHHGSLSRDLREDTEIELKSGHPVTALCTSTLEMGIDLGTVRAVGQVGPTWTVASLVQRLGRSGRKDGEAQTLRMYTIDDPLTQNSSLPKRLYPELVRAIALIELHREKWLEPLETARLHFSTCLHQVLSMLRQTGGARAARLFEVLCKKGAFRHITSHQFSGLLRGMAEKQLIEQIPTGELILAPEGEHIVESRDFYSAFASSIEYRIESKGDQIGVLPRDCIPMEGEFMLLAGRRWRVELIDDSGRRVEVIPARGWKQPKFNGGIGGVHTVVMARMKRIYSENTDYPYLNSSSVSLLRDARNVFKSSGLQNRDFLAGGDAIDWFPWAGTRVLLTLKLCAIADGLAADWDELRVHYQKCSADDFLSHCERIAQGTFTPAALVALIKDIERDRFDEFVPRELLEQSFSTEALDLPMAKELASGIIRTR